MTIIGGSASNGSGTLARVQELLKAERKLAEARTSYNARGAGGDAIRIVREVEGGPVSALYSVATLC